MYECYLTFAVGVGRSICRAITIIEVGVDYRRTIYDMGVNKKRSPYKIQTERTQKYPSGYFFNNVLSGNNHCSALLCVRVTNLR